MHHQASSLPAMRWFTLLTGASLLACAAGSDDGGGSPSTGGSVPWTTSTGGAPGQGGEGGQGGDPSTSSGGGGQGGIADGGGPIGGRSEGGSSEGGGTSGQAVLIAIGGSGALAASYDEADGWQTQTLAAAPTHRPSIALRAPDDGLALIRNAGQLSFSAFDGVGWSAFAPVGPSVTTRATPALAAGAVTMSSVFHGDDFKHYYAAYASSWSPTGELVGTPQAFGPEPAAIAVIGSDVVIGYAGNDGDLYDQTRTSGSWLAPHAHLLGDTVEGTPTIVRLDQGAELLMVFQRKPSDAVSFVTRTGGTWSASADLPDTLTNEPVALAPLSGGRAVAAFRGTNAQIYSMIYDPSNAPVWSDPLPLASPNPTTATPPALAAGVNSADAELVYVDGTTQSVMHSRLTGSSWSTPALVGGTDLGSVAIASHP